MRLTRIMAVVWKELLQLARDPRMYPIVLIAPVVQLFLYGYAATFDLHRLPVAAVDADRSGQSRALLRRIEASGDFRVAFHARSLREAERLVDRGDCRAALVLPPGFGRALEEGRPAEVGIFLDGTDSNTATIARSSLEAIIGRRAIELRVGEARARDPAAAAVLAALEGPEGLPEALEVRTRVLYNPELRSANYMVPGVVVIVLLIMTTTLSSLSIVKEREIGTFEMLSATPLGAGELVLGKLVPFVGIGFLDVLIIVATAALWFEVPIRGSVGLVFALAGAFILTTIAGGLFVSSIATSQQQAMILSFLVLVPMILLSGLIFPLHSMPAPVQALSYALPIRYFVEALRAIFLRGVGLDVLYPNALAMLGLGAALLSAAVLRFRATM